MFIYVEQMFMKDGSGGDEMPYIPKHETRSQRCLGYVEDAVRFDANLFTKKKMEPFPCGGCKLVWHPPAAWSQGHSYHIIREFSVLALVDGEIVILRFRGKNQVIELKVTPRLFMCCPDCGRPCRFLYLPHPEAHFACRECHKLGYWDWRESGWKRIPHKQDAAISRRILKVITK